MARTKNSMHLATKNLEKIVMRTKEVARQAEEFDKSFYRKFYPHYSDWIRVRRMTKQTLKDRYKEESVWLPSTEARNAFIKEIEHSERELYMATGALNPAIGVFGDEKVLKALDEKLKEKTYNAIFIIGTTVMLRDEDNRNPFFDYLKDNYKRVLIYQYKEDQILPFHVKVIDGRDLTLEYPHFEFEHYRCRIKAPNCPKVIEKIKSFYENRVTHLATKGALKKIRLAPRNEFSIINRVSKEYETWKNGLKP